MKIKLIEPFGQASRLINARIAGGQTLGQLVPEAHHEAVAKCVVNEFPQKDWKAYIPHDADDIELYVVPRVTAAIAGAITAATAGAVAGGVATAIAVGIQLAIAVGLSFAAQALASKPKPSFTPLGGASSARREEAFGVAGLTNTVVPGTPKFVVYGERRVFGHIIGTRIEVAEDGKSMAFSVLYLMGDTGGDGYESITDIEINRTPATDIDGVTTEVRLGTDPQTVMNDFEEVAQTYHDGRQLIYNTPIVYTLQDANASRAHLVVEWPGGLKKINPNSGEPSSGKSEIKIEYKRVSDPSWILHSSNVVQRKTESKLFQEFKVNFGSADAWEVRVTEAHDKNSTTPPTISPDPFLFNVEEIQTTTRTYPGTALLAVRGVGSDVIQSLNQLAVSALVRGKKVKRWNGSSFDLVWTQQRAWIARDMLTHKKVGMGNRIPESFHNDDAAKSVQDTVWDAMVDGFDGDPQEIRDRCDVVVNEKRAGWDWIKDVLAEGRAAYIPSAGQYKMIVNAAKTPDQMYAAPGNIIEGSIKRELGFENKSINTVRGEFPDEDNNYKTNFVEIQDSDIGSDPIKDKNYTFLTLVRESNVYREIMFYLKEALLIKRRFKWASPHGASHAEPFDVTRFSYRTFNFKRGYSGTLLKASSGTTHYLDKPVTLEPSKTYKLYLYATASVSDPNALDELTITTPAGTYGIVETSGASTFGTEPGTVWALGEDGVGVISVLIESVKAGDQGQVELTAAEYHANVYTQDPLPSKSQRRFFRIPETKPIPLWDAQVSEATILNHDGSTASLIVFDVTPGLVKASGPLKTTLSSSEFLFYQDSPETLPLPTSAGYFVGAKLTVSTGPTAGETSTVIAHDEVGGLYNRLRLSPLLSGDPDDTPAAQIKLEHQDFEATGGFVIELGETDTGPWTEIAEVKGFHHEMDASGDARTLYYRFTPVSVRGVRNSQGRWIRSLAFTGDTSAPAAPTGVAITVGVNRVKLEWTNTTAIDLDKVRIYRHTANDFSGATLAGEQRGTVFTDDQLAADTYYFWLTSIDFSGNEGAAHRTQFNGQAAIVVSVFDNVAPATPTWAATPLVTSGRITNDGAFLAEIQANWTDNSESDLSGYHVQFKKTADGWEDGHILTVETSQALIDFLEGNVSYDVRVRAFDSSGNNSPWTALETITTSDTPGAPSQVLGVSVIQLPLALWVAWSQNPENDIAYYEVEVDDHAGFTSPAVAARVNSLSWIQEINGAGITWYFRVRAVRRTGTPGNWSAIVSGTTLWNDGITILNQTITETKIADNAISTPKLQANSVTANEISTNTITANEVAAHTLTGTQLRTDIAVITQAAQIANLLVGNQHIANATITSAKIGTGQILTANIGNLNVTSIKIADNAVTNKGEVSDSSEQVTLTEKTLLSLNITTVTGNAVLVVAKGVAPNLDQNSDATLRIKRGSTILETLSISGVTGNTVATYILMKIDSPGTGIINYSLTGSGDDGFGAGIGLNNLSLLVTEFIK